MARAQKLPRGSTYCASARGLQLVLCDQHYSPARELFVPSTWCHGCCNSNSPDGSFTNGTVQYGDKTSALEVYARYALHSVLCSETIWSIVKYLVKYPVGRLLIIIGCFLRKGRHCRTTTWCISAYVPAGSPNRLERLCRCLRLHKVDKYLCMHACSCTHCQTQLLH